MDTNLNRGILHTIRNAELTAIIGGDCRIGNRVISGIHFLASIHEGNTAVAGGGAHLVENGCRGTNPNVDLLDDGGVAVWKEAGEDNGFIEHHNVYRLKDPYYIDLEFTMTAKSGASEEPAHAASWCCYMNSPINEGIHFIENGVWRYYYNPIHGQAAMLFPTGISDEVKYQQLARHDRNAATPHFGLKPDPMQNFDGVRGFHISDSGHTFDYPFYFGDVRGMIYQIMVDTHKDCRFFLSPSGGGPGVIPGKWNPAWDLMWIAGKLKEGESKTVNIRIAYLRVQTSNHYMADTAIEEYKKFTEEYPIRNG